MGFREQQIRRAKRLQKLRAERFQAEKAAGRFRSKALLQKKIFEEKANIRQLKRIRFRQAGLRAQRGFFKAKAFAKKAKRAVRKTGIRFEF